MESSLQGSEARDVGTGTRQAQEVPDNLEAGSADPRSASHLCIASRLERRVSARCGQAARTYPAADHGALRTSGRYRCPRRRKPLRDQPQVAGMEDVDS